MITKDGNVKLLEHNIRFGDPECQVLMARLTSDLTALLLAAANGTLENAEVTWSDDSAVVVVMAANGYPGSYAKGEVISNSTPRVISAASRFYTRNRLERRRRRRLRRRSRPRRHRLRLLHHRSRRPLVPGRGHHRMARRFQPQRHRLARHRSRERGSMIILETTKTRPPQCPSRDSFARRRSRETCARPPPRLPRPHVRSTDSRRSPRSREGRSRTSPLERMRSTPSASFDA